MAERNHGAQAPVVPQEGPFPPIQARGERGSVFVPAPPSGLVLAACQVKVEWLLTDPSQLWVAPVPDFCAPGLHCARETAAIEYWGGEPWLQINTIYTSSPVHAVARTHYLRPEQMPFFLIEATYENGKEQSPARRVRTQSYHALLSGAAGHVFGNNPIWHFSGPGLYPVPYTWQQSLGLIGSQAMTHLWNLMSTQEWWRLVPDLNNSFLTAGLGTGHDRAVAALADDQSFAIAYLPAGRPISVNLARLWTRMTALRPFPPSL